MEVVAWVNNKWQTQWLSGYTSDDVGSFMVQVGCMVFQGCRFNQSQAISV
jgi:hypothetical protein